MNSLLSDAHINHISSRMHCSHLNSRQRGKANATLFSFVVPLSPNPLALFPAAPKEKKDHSFVLRAHCGLLCNSVQLPFASIEVCKSTISLRRQLLLR
jgi:hypothetical protein